MTAPESLERLMLRLIQHRRGLPKDPELAALAAQHFTGNARLSPVEQIEIYREQFWLRHTSALLEDFPGVSGIIGQMAWERLCEDYLAAHPPASFSLRDVGAHLPEFIATQAAWLDHQSLVTDMARLEWAFVEVFDAQAAMPLAPERLAGIDWNHAHIVLAPALRLLRVTYPVSELRRHLLSAQETQEAARYNTNTNADTKQFLGPGPQKPTQQRLLIHRPALSILVERMDEAEFALLEALEKGEALPNALEAACERSGLAGESLSSSLGGWFQAWVERVIIVDVEP